MNLPATYAEARPFLGKTIATPIGDLRCRGTGWSGTVISLTFEGITWSNTHGWETIAQIRARHWWADWKKLGNPTRELITLVLGHDLASISFENRINVNNLLAIAKRRLIGAGSINHQACTRCEGSGKYSWCQTYGDTCFKCGGSGKALPTTASCLKVARAAS